MPQQKTHWFSLGPDGFATVDISGFSFHYKDQEGSPILVSVQDVPEELMLAIGRGIPLAFKRSEQIHRILEKTGSVSGRPQAESHLVSIGDRIKALRGEASVLLGNLQDWDGEDADEETDAEMAIEFLSIVKNIPNPRPKIAAIKVDYRPRPDWNDLDKAQDLRDELDLIVTAFDESGLKDKALSEAIDEAGGFMYQF